MINVEKIKPTGLFTNYIYKAIPLAFDESMSYYETLCGLLSYLKDTVIPTLNNNADAIIEVQNLITQLQSYVDNYFDNLDVQEEINNKLDDMAEHGELTDIIAQYLQLAGVLAFNTVNDLINAENIVNGSICKTLGDITYNDGKGAFYKIRTITSADVVDGVNIIALNVSDTLIAEKMPDYYINEINNNLTNINNDINTTNTRITNLNTIKNLVIIGDSYGVGNSYPTDPITSFAEYMKNTLNLTNDTFYNNSYGGCGFAHVSNNKTFLTLINECENNLTEERRNNVTHVLFAGGYNDQFNNETEIKNGIINCVNRANILFPNAKIYIAHIGWSTNSSSLNDTARYYSDGAGLTKFAKYITNSENILRGDLISGDNIHPNEDGYKFLSCQLINGLQTGSCAPKSSYKYLKDNNDNNLGVVQCNNDILTYEMFDTEFTINGTANGNEISYKTLSDDSMISGHGNFHTMIPCIFVNNTNGSYVNGYCIMKIDQRLITLKPYAINNNGDNYFSFTSIRLTGQYILIPHKNI